MSGTEKNATEQGAESAAGSTFGLLNRVLDFLSRYFLKLPPSLRATAYFIVLVFFVSTAWRLTFGEYLVRGVIWDGDKYAQDCEIRLRGDYFSTNSKGMYYTVLTPVQYYRYFLSSEVDLPIMRRQADGTFVRLKGPHSVKLSWWDDEFSDLDLSAPPAQPGLTSAISFDLVPAAFAQTRNVTRPAQSTAVLRARPDRLVVDRLQLGTGMKVREGKFGLVFADDQRSSLLIQGSEAGSLPMRGSVRLGEKYYFAVPQQRRGQTAQIIIQDPGLFGSKETFDLRIPSKYDQPATIRGTSGSLMIIKMMPPG